MYDTRDHFLKTKYRNDSKKFLEDSIDIFLENVINDPKEESDKAKNAETFYYLSSTHSLMANKDRKNLQYYNTFATWYYIQALMSDPNPRRNNQRYSELHKYQRQTLSKFGISDEEYDDNIRSKILHSRVVKMIEDESDRIKFIK